MKKLKVLLVCMLAFMLAGCMQFKAKITIDEDGKGKISEELLVQSGMMESYGLSEKDLKKSIQDGGNYPDSEYTFKNITKTIDDVEYKGISLESKKSKKLTGEGVTFKKDGDKMTLTMDAKGLTTGINNQMDTSSYSEKELKEMGFSMTLEIEMPGEIKEAKGGKIDGNTVTYNLATYKGSEIKIISEKSDNTLLYVGIGVGILIAAGIIIFVVMKKKQQNNGNDNLEPQSESSSNPTIDKVEAQNDNDLVTTKNEDTSVDESINDLKDQDDEL